MNTSQVNVSISMELCAAHFLLQWKRKEEALHKSFSKEPCKVTLRKILSFFVIARNFKDVQKDTLKVADDIISILNECDGKHQLSMIKKVEFLANEFQKSSEKETSRLRPNYFG